ncbi:MAG TPA: hypothetical protein VGL91_16080 [Acidobacteriota bacterium]|jgi:hypothetical protein
MLKVMRKSEDYSYRYSVARPKKRAGLMTWKNGKQSQGSASSALGFNLPPSQKAAGPERFQGPRRWSLDIFAEK